MDRMTASRFSAAAVTVLKFLVLAAFIAFLLYSSAGGRVSTAAMEAVSAAVTEAASLDPMSPGGDQMIRRLYGLDPDTFDGALLYYPSTNMGAEELLLIRLSDISQQDVVREAMEARISSQIGVFEGYAPAQVAMLEKGVVEVRGNYALLIVAEDVSSVLRAFEAAL